MHGARQGCGPREDDAVQRLLPLSSLAWRLTLVETDGGARAYRALSCRVVDSWAQTDVYDMGKRSTTARYLCRTGPLPAMATVVCLITI